jgi:tetratricopeptide (TPR) repeat protein
MLGERPGDAVLPETVQGLIAARLDTLPRDEKELLCNAAVIGRAFWLGALGPERWTLEDLLHALVRVEFVRRERRSTVAGEGEYSFRHTLMRDVAYEQIPRAERADKHRRAAEWIETLGRVDDHAEMLAYHYGAALGYARATGQTTSQFEEAARTAFREAGDRAFGLNAFPAAARYFAQAAELWPREDPDWPELLFSLARAYHVGGDERREQALEAAREASLAAGRLEHAAEADALLAEACWYRRDRERCDHHLGRAAELVAELPDSPAKALVLSQVARYRMLADEFEDAIPIAKEALAMAERLGLDELRAHALDNIGTSRVNLGDANGIADLELAAEIALAARSPEAARALNNLSSVHASLGDFRRQGELLAEAVRVGEELGALSLWRYSRATLVGNLIWTGSWDEGLRLAEAWIAEAGAEASSGELGIRRNRARVLLARDDVDGALEDIARAVDGSRQMAEPQTLFPALGAAARVYLEVGREEEARALGAELMEQMKRAADWRVLDFALVAGELGYADELRLHLEQLPATRLTAANLALVAGDFGRAAELLDEGGIAFAAADARRYAAEQLGRDGRRGDAEEQLEQALAFYRSVRATRCIRECQTLRDELELPA